MTVLDDPIVASIRLPFNETVDEILPTDAAAGVEDFHGDTGATPDLTVPVVEQNDAFGWCRVFGTDEALIAEETVEDSTRHLRSVTIEAVVTFDVASYSDTDYGTIVQRGAGGSAAERILWGLRIQRVSSTNAKIFMRWQEADGTEAVVAGKEFVVPGSHFYVWVMRRWISDTASIVRYGLNDAYLGEETVGESDIGNGGLGAGLPTAVYLGCSPTGANYQDFWKGRMFGLRVTPEERSKEELLQVYRTMAIHLPAGYAQARKLVPENVYSDDPDSVIQRELQVEGTGLGLVQSTMAELVEDGLPDRAWSVLHRWEEVLGINPQVGATFEQRRTAVISFLQSSRQFDPESLKLAIADLFDLDSTDVEVIEGSNKLTDIFASTYEPFWLLDIGAGGNGSQSNPAANTVQISIGSSAGDGRWAHADNTELRSSLHYREGFDDTRNGAFIDVEMPFTGQTFPFGSVVTHAGLLMYNRVSRDGLMIGIRGNGSGGLLRAYSRRLYSWGADASVARDGAAFSSGSMFFRIRHDGDGTYTIFWDTSSALANSAQIVDSFLPDTVALVALRANSSSDTGAVNARFQNYSSYFPGSLAPYSAIVYRDPMIAGSPQMDKAGQLVRRLKQSHTHVCATQYPTVVADNGKVGCEVLD